MSDGEPNGKPAVPLKQITTESLFEGAREVVLVHNGEAYRLRITARGRLILTK